MLRIISVASLTLGLALGSSLARSEDQPAPAETAPAAAEAPVLQDNVPARYVVVKGDTLWGISARYLRNPWKWPELWGINKDEIRNPHWIYPGDVLVLDLSGKTPRLRLEGEADGGASRWYGYELQVSRLSPQMRASALNALPIPTIAAKDIDPFLVRPLVVDADQVNRAPSIIAASDKRVVVSAGDVAYVSGLNKEKGPRWQVYRKGRMFQDPDTKELLGFEAVYLGDADVTGFGEVSTVQIAKANQEIGLGDRLTIAPPLQTRSYIPHAPDKPVRGTVIAGSDNSVWEIGTYQVVILNRGAREGLEVGNVLALYKSEGKAALPDGRVVQLPEQRYGLLMVFRVFEKLSYALVMTATKPVNVRDNFGNP